MEEIGERLDKLDKSALLSMLSNIHGTCEEARGVRIQLFIIVPLLPTILTYPFTLLTFVVIINEHLRGTKRKAESSLEDVSLLTSSPFPPLKLISSLTP
jgi:hypothetical protein